MSNLRLFFYLIYCSRVFAIARVIVALPKKSVICEKQTPNFSGFERLELKHSKQDT